MRERGLQIALMCLGVAVAAYAGCGSDTATGGTTTGDTSTTTTTSTTTSTTSTTATSSGSGTTATGMNSDENLGLQCGSDGDCGANLKCLTADGNNVILGGGPADGYCSRDCALDTDCPGADAFCLGAAAGKPGICLLTCTLGPELMFLNDPLDPAKCHGREDVRCATLNTQEKVTACVPSCGRDDQCPAGRFCDQRSAMCVAKPSTGLPLGSKCNQQTMPPECAGVCVSFGGGVTMCSSPCVLGGEIDPNDLAAITDCGGLDKGICVYSAAAESGVGDLGICGAACVEQDDCQNPAFWCRDVGSAIGLTKGYCLGGTPCPKGQGDCKSPDICTDTKYGPFCTNPKFPLGDAAPVGTTSSASASGSSGSGSSSGSGVGGASSSGSGVGGASSSGSGVGGASSASTGP